MFPWEQPRLALPLRAFKPIISSEPHVVNRTWGFGTKQTWVPILTRSLRGTPWITWVEALRTSTSDCCWLVKWLTGAEWGVQGLAWDRNSETTAMLKNEETEAQRG